MRGNRIRATLNVFARWWRDSGGGMGVTAAISLPVLVGASAIAIELSSINSTRNKMQGMVDQAVIAAARELRLGNATQDTILDVARNHIAASVPALNLPYEFNGQVAGDRKSLNISIQATLTPGIGAAAGLAPTSITASATAKVMGGAPLCAIGLDSAAPGTIDLEKQAKMEAKACSVYSNSAHSMGVRAKDSATITAATICTAGGKSGDATAYSPSPDLDCPQIPDPLGSRPAPPVGSCDALKTNLSIVGLVTFLTPGTYCGGLTILNNSIVTMQPGIYVIKDGTFNIGSGSKLIGVDVGIYFTGDTTNMVMGKDTIIALKAPHTGPMAGILMWQDRTTTTTGNKFEIASDDAAMLLGTIYLPRGQLNLTGDKPVAQSSAYTIVVANKINLTAGPTMVLNSDYASTTVPVPSGVGPSAGQVMLQR